MINAVVLDAFGTILRIDHPTNPYRELIREGRRQGIASGSESLGLVMTKNLAIDEMASFLGIALTPLQREKMSQALELELSSIRPFSDALEAIPRLLDAGLKVGVCSNLASPYGPVVRRLFPKLHGYAYSYELGLMKPNPAIYQAVCAHMGIEPGHYLDERKGGVFMTGDSKRCDQDGPRSVGIMGLHLDRTGRGSINDLLQFAELVIDHNLKFSSVS